MHHIHIVSTDIYFCDPLRISILLVVHVYYLKYSSWPGIISHYTLYYLPRSFSARVFQPWSKCSCKIFLLLLEYHIMILYLFILGNLWPWSLHSCIWNLLFATNFQYGHCAHVYFNAVHFWHRVILNQFMSYNWINWSKQLACLIINVSNDGMYCICTSLVKIIISLLFHIDFSHI